MHMTPNMSVKLRFQSDSLVNPGAGKVTIVWLPMEADFSSGYGQAVQITASLQIN